MRRMAHALRGLGFVLIASMLACAGQQRLERVRLLSDEGKELFSKYKQFMTEGQQEAFLALDTDEQRQDYVTALKVEERLSRYPDYIQKAIWSQEVVPGMDRAAVLLTWSTPDLREWDQAELARGNEVERWSYRRDDQWVQVVIANGVVTVVQRAESAK